MPATTRDRGAFGRLMSPKQVASIVETIDTDKKVVLYTGAVSAGKTFASMVAFFAAVPKAPTNGLIVIVGRSLLTIERNIIDQMMSVELFGPLAEQVHHTAGSSVATILGRTVHLVGASDSRSEGRIRGATIGLVMVDEATLVPQAFWMMLMSRLRVLNAKCIATTNPDSPNHWLRKDFIVKADEVSMLVFDFRISDNPKLPEGYEDILKAQYVGIWRRRFIEGLWVVAEGAVYDMWDENRHIVRGAPPQISRFPGVGVDHGTSNPFSAHMLGIAPADASRGLPSRLVITREYRHDPKVAGIQKTDAEFSRDLREWIGQDQPAWVAVDPAAASFKVQLYHDGVSNVINAKNDVVGGIRLVSSLLYAGRLVVHESCKGLIDEIGGYTWDPAASERGEDVPIKANDHGLDSSRYAIATTQAEWRHDVPVNAPALAA
jgi:PBSX family phage terminase large subunit